MDTKTGVSYEEGVALKDVEALIEEAEVLKTRIQDYRGAAQWIDDRFERANEHRNYIPLDDYPYGEELLRTRGLEKEIEVVVDVLDELLQVEFPPEQVNTAFYEAVESVREARETLEDCTPVPEEEHQEDVVGF